MAPAHRIEIFHGNEVEPWLDAVARLRIAVFRDWPYLYEGAPDYEKEYLATYAKSPGSVFVLAIDGDEVVGASTGLPLADETDAFKSPFIGQDIAIGEVFYFGESVLLPGYRGGGIGHAFFDAREARARELGLGITRSVQSIAAMTTPAGRPVTAATRRSGSSAATRAAPA